MAYPSILRFTRPRTFLYLMSLRTGTELIVLTVLINKLTGVYGILALLTGFHLSPIQLSMYMYSILALLLTAWLAPHVRKQSPLQCLALAWFYVLDSVINALYTVAFGVGWFLVLANHHSGDNQHSGPGSNMIGDTAGFTNPEHTVSHVEVAATAIPSSGAGNVKIGPDSALIGHHRPQHGGYNPSPSTGSTPSVSGVLGNTILQSGSIASITVISALWAVRVYFILVVMAYARGVLRQHIVLSSAAASAQQQQQQQQQHLDAGATSSSSAPGTSPLAPTSTNDSAATSNVVPRGSSDNSTDTKPMLPPSPESASSSHQALPSPFTPPSTLSAGWTGKLGRAFVAVFPSYWLGAPVDGEESAIFDYVGVSRGGHGGVGVGGVGGRKSDVGATPGVFERERRRRAGTGPPMLKPIELEQVRK